MVSNVKNQYFADTRDLFKYDLILDLLTKSRLSHFTFIPMLTPDDPNYTGGRANYDRMKIRFDQPQLRNFMKDCLRMNTRRIVLLEQFFARWLQRKGLRISIYKRGEHFSHQKRQDYFANIPSTLLTKSVILVDPDIGLEVPSMKGKEDRYLHYDEVLNIYDRMDESSILLIFQFIPRVKRKPYLSQLGNKILARTPRAQTVYYVSDNQIAFFALAKGQKSSDQLLDYLASYAYLNRLILGRT